MSNHDIELPPLPYPYDTPAYRTVGSVIKEYARAAIKADRQQRGEPVAFSYELATTRSGDGEYTHWSPRLSYSMPNVPEGSIRNLKRLYASPLPAEPAKLPSDDEVLEAMRPSLDEGDGGYICDMSPMHVIASGRALLARYGSKS